jgi:hypothetical protein
MVLVAVGPVMVVTTVLDDCQHRERKEDLSVKADPRYIGQYGHCEIGCAVGKPGGDGGRPEAGCGNGASAVVVAGRQGRPSGGEDGGSRQTGLHVGDGASELTATRGGNGARKYKSNLRHGRRART